MWDLIVSVPDHCLSFYFEPDNVFEYCKLTLQKICTCVLTKVKVVLRVFCAVD